MSSYSIKHKPREVSRMFNKIIGDEIVLNRERQEAEKKKQERDSDPEYKLGELRRALVRDLSEANKQNPDNSYRNIIKFIENLESFIVKEFTMKSEYDKKLKASLSKVDKTMDIEKQNKIKAKNMIKLQNEMKLGTPKHLDDFVQKYSVHVDNIIKFDNATDNEFNLIDSFLKFINERMQVLYSRFANMILKKQKHLQNKTELGV